MTKETRVYKVKDGIEIHADLYLPDATRHPSVLIWIHGGALVMGSRGYVPANLLELCQATGSALASIDYRLAPQAKLPAIIEDLKDAVQWTRETFRPWKLVVAGESAGGYLAMMTGTFPAPRPDALVSYYGYGDVDGGWYTLPSDHYQRLFATITKEEAVSGMGNRVVTGAADGPAQQGRERYYHYLRQKGLWTREVTGIDPAAEPRALDPFCPVRNVDPDYPPILMVHGANDKDVPFEKSSDMARELARNGVAHELLSVPGAGHGLEDGDPALVERVHAQALAFIRKHIADPRH